MATVSATGTGTATETGPGSIAPHYKQGGFIDYSIDIDTGIRMDPVSSTSGGGDGDGQDVNKETSLKGKERETSHERDDGSDSDDQKYVHFKPTSTRRQKMD
jgi:hypothetical protein